MTDTELFKFVDDEYETREATDEDVLKWLRSELKMRWELQDKIKRLTRSLDAANRRLQTFDLVKDGIELGHKNDVLKRILVANNE